MFKPALPTSLFLPILTVFFAPLIEGGTTYLPFFIISMLVLSMLGVFLRDGLRHGRISFVRTPLDRAILPFLIVIIISAWVAPYKYPALVWVQVTFYYVLFFYLTVQLLPDRRAVMPAVYAVLSMGALQVVTGLAQRMSGAERVNGTFFNPDMLAAYLNPLLLIAVSLILFRSRRARGRALKAGLTLLSVSTLFVIFFTGSRGGVLSLAVGLLVVLWARWRMKAALVVAALVVAAAVFPNPVRDRVLNSSDPYAWSRASIWQSAGRMMMDHPMGIGLGNFRQEWATYNFPTERAVIKYGKVADTAHNDYLNIGAEMGFAGLAAFLFGVVLSLKFLKRSLDASDPDDRPIAVGIAGGITADLAHSFVDSVLHEPGIVFLLILLFCISLALSRREGPKVMVWEIPPSKKKRLAYLSSVLLFLLVIWAAMPMLGYYYSEKSTDALKAGDAATALHLADRALFMEPGDADYHSIRASVLYNIFLRDGDSGRLKASLEELDEAARLDPREGRFPLIKAQKELEISARLPAPERRAWMLAALGDAMKAARLDPFGAEALMTKAVAQNALGNRDEAIQTLEGLKRVEPDYLRGRLLLARLYLDAGKIRLSQDELSNIIETRKTLARQTISPQERAFSEVGQSELEKLQAKLEKES